MLKLIGTDADRYYTWELNPGTYTIGRKSGSSKCDFTVSDMAVSRKHAKLEVSSDNNGGCLISDLNSHNGTYVNGQKIYDSVSLKPGDSIQFGSSEFKLVEESGISSTTPKPTRTQLSDFDPEQSVIMPMNEALKPLPAKVADLPELLPTLFDMANMLVGPEPKEIMLERSLQLVTKIIPADRLAVLFTPEDCDETFTGALHLPTGKDPGTFTLSQTIINNIKADKNAILIDDAKEDPQYMAQESIISSDLKSAMAVPLLDEDRVLGILYADTTSPIHRYNDDFLHLFAMMGNIIASRLTNYSLLREKQVKEVYEAELKRASSIQKTLLPRKIPEFPGYSVHAFQEQCRSVGGDLYDVEVLPDGRLLFMVADVSGKGMGAALLMSNILASFRILYPNDNFDLERAVKQVSVELFKHSASDNFATLFIGLLDPSSNKLDFINSGHNPPLLIRKDGKLEYLEPSGPMIGAFDFIGWSMDTAKMNPEDLLVIFTDGVTEAEKGEDLYGDEKLEELIIGCHDCTPEVIAQNIVDDVEKFVEDTPRSDDITMLIIKRNK